MKFRDKNPTWRDRLATAMRKMSDALKAKDEAAAAEAQKEADAALQEAPTGDEGVAIHLHTGPNGTQVNDDLPTGDPIPALGDDDPTDLPARMTDEEIQGGFGELRDSIEALRQSMDAIAQHVGFQGADATPAEEEEILDEIPEEMRDGKPSLRDSAALRESFQQTISMAEVLAPGIRLPTFDAALTAKKTYDAMCGLRRRALDLAYNTPAGRDAIDELNGGKRLNLDGMKCRDVKNLFRGAAVLVKTRNSTSVRDSNANRIEPTASPISGVTGPVGGMSISKMQEMLNKHYGQG